MVNFYYKIIREPMLQFKKEIRLEVANSKNLQETEQILQEI